MKSILNYIKRNGHATNSELIEYFQINRSYLYYQLEKIEQIDGISKIDRFDAVWIWKNTTKTHN